MKSQLSINIVNESWDYLIVLDACRYDYFERLRSDYLPEGKLSCKWSTGSCTDEWRDMVFPDTYEDIIYISANPHICADQTVAGYCAGGHFHEVVEVWKDCWDSEIGTVKPEVLTDVALDFICNNCNKGKRYVIHYLQPHAPYLCLGASSKGHSIGDISKRTSTIGDDLTRFMKTKQYLYNLLYSVIKHTDFFGNRPDWAIRKFLELPPKSPMEYALRRYNIDKLRKAYEENLKFALSQVSRLMRYLSGTVVITSDHGEFLGEHKWFSHPRECNHQIVRQVPWLEVNLKENKLEYKSKSETGRIKIETEKTEDIILERLRDLGYHD